MNVNDLFHKFAVRASGVVGSPWAFALAMVIIVAWGVSGPAFGYSDTWQLVINTGTTIVTFLMVFLIQNTQNRDARAIHLKLDELIRAAQGARRVDRSGRLVGGRAEGLAAGVAADAAAVRRLDAARPPRHQSGARRARRAEAGVKRGAPNSLRLLTANF